MEKKTPEEWGKLKGITILDPDGWRTQCGDYPAQDFNVPVTLEEFNARVVVSTIAVYDSKATFRTPIEGG